jgi:Raf kinase inhibitor-like YbhB/YbcL family protein
MSLKIEIPALQQGHIPREYTCEGENKSPELKWSGVPAHAESLALICDDPDALSKTWVHWVAYDIPVKATGIPEAAARTASMPPMTVEGSNDSGKTGYSGPCPPSGTHRYFFKLYALDSALELKPGATKAELLKAMHGHILEEAEAIGRYAKQKQPA